MFRNQEGKIEVAPCTLPPSKLPGENLCFLFPRTSLGSVGLEVLASSGDGVLPPRDRVKESA